MLWNNIPSELRALNHWVVSGADKIPLNPRTGQPASVIDPATWATFEEACRAGYKHIGFVLNSDPYTIIDLDNKPDKPLTKEQHALHEVILNTFASYTERSTSGRGYHIIVKGSIPAGVHRDSVEVYSRGRYMICTGDVVRQVPIIDAQQLLDNMYSQMKPADTVELEDREGLHDDAALVDMADGAVNGDKFRLLCNGKWAELNYPSQSEADFALLAMLAFYTPDNSQVRRIFRHSGLGKRDKATVDNKYLNRCLQKIRATQSVGNPDISKLTQLAAEVAKNTEDQGGTDVQAPEEKPRGGENSNEEIVEQTRPLHEIELPPGLIGDLATYFYSSAVRPVPEIALTAAIAVTAGVCGRAYNISGTGLNQYIILLAKTGSGKEGAVSGIDRLMSAVKPRIPMIDDFIGPSAFASGQALIKVLDERPCFVSVLGEFGLTLQQLCDPQASSAQIMFKKVLLDVYSKSGFDQKLRSSVYSDVEKNTKVIQAPNVTLLAESTPETFFVALDAHHISEGLIPRFMIVEYTGNRPARNKSAGSPPSAELVSAFETLAARSLAASANNTFQPIQIDYQAQDQLDQFDLLADKRINTAKQDVESQLWNRAHLKSLKLAGLISVGVNPHQPIVTDQIAKWAISFVQKDIETIINRFQTGDVGKGGDKQSHDVTRIIRDYIESKNFNTVKAYGVDEKMYKDRIVPYVYIQRRTASLSAFKNAKIGGRQALKNVLDDLLEGGVLVELSPQQVVQRYESKSRAFGIGKAWQK